MVESHCKADCRVDQFRISDAPHTEYFDSGLPVQKGGVIRKAIREFTLICPLCSTDTQPVNGRYDEDETPLCPECGLILSGDGTPRTSDGAPLLTDAKAAGRVADDTPQQ